MPVEFTLKDEQNNYYSGKNGVFEKNLNFGEFDNVKIRLNDGSRIVGSNGKRYGEIDIITKGVYSPCKSRIKIGNFICPTWQLEGEKILHDNKNLFLYQKHAKMRIINTPVYYIPYLVTPSPLRKDRKSGFLSPTINFNFYDTKYWQSVSFPYYFNLAIDKELTFTPLINYGAGVDSNQRFSFDYNQILSGGFLSSRLKFDSNFANQNNNKWLKDASLITNYNQNISNNYRLTISSALQTSKNYIQITNPNDDLSYKNSLSTNIVLEGFNLNKIDDYLKIQTNFYQTNQKNEDNKTTPTVFPHITYYSGNEFYNGYNTENLLEGYNIFRDKNTSIHAQNQQKLSHRFNISKEIIAYKSKISLNSENYTQIFHTENKLLHSNKFHTGEYFRIFPIIGLKLESPFKLEKNLLDFTYNPSIQFVVSPGMSNSNKLSNEDSSNNNFTLSNISSLNRYSGSDKLDNSKRVNYGFTIQNQEIKFNLYQSYEFTNNSNFHYKNGDEKNLSDLIGSLDYNKVFNASYAFNYDSNKRFLKTQNITLTGPVGSEKNNIGNFNLKYLDQKSKTDNLITQDTETLNYEFTSKKFLSFSKINFKGLYNFKNEINSEYSIGYDYWDECFGIQMGFSRKSYEEDNLKPQDVLTIMFSFKNVGSYRSTNLAVSETDKQDINWRGVELNNELFADYE